MVQIFNPEYESLITMDDYKKKYEKSIENADVFWSGIADRISWDK